jgi:choline kinase
VEQTQYGNILRLTADTESPLLLPTNEHKRLIVIDFEYANANVPGLEFANHFVRLATLQTRDSADEREQTEWCYDYHARAAPHACRVDRYPTPAQQNTFLAAYLAHRPSAAPAARSPSAPGTPAPVTPALAPIRSTASIAALVLDARRGARRRRRAASDDDDYDGSEDDDDDGDGRGTNGDEGNDGGGGGGGGDPAALRRAMAQLRAETRAWRAANSAQWVLWGVVQAKVAGAPLSPAPPPMDAAAASQSPSAGEADGAHEGGFDYLAYARERAAFFWGDVIGLGVMRREELPTDVVAGARVVEY